MKDFSLHTRNSNGIPLLYVMNGTGDGDGGCYVQLTEELDLAKIIRK